MNKITLTMALTFALIFSSCTSANKNIQGNKDISSLTEEEKQKEQEALLKKQEEENSAKEREQQQYDGERYVGKAKQDFIKGVEVYFQEGCSSSIEKWKESYEKDPLAQIAFNIALCYQRANSTELSYEWYIKSFNSNLNDARPLYNAYFISHDNVSEKFEKMMKLSLKINDEVEKNIFIAWLNLEKNNLDNAIKYSKKALKLDEQNIDAMVVLGTAYYKKKMTELATSIFSTAEQINPDNFKLQRIYGFLEYDNKNKGNALMHFQKAKKLNPEMPEVLNMIAVLYMETEDFAMAEKELDAALSLYPGFYAAKLNLAIVYKGLSKFKESAELFSSLEQNSSFPADLKKKLYYNKAILYLDADVEGDKKPERYDLAVAALKQYLEFVPKTDKDEAKKVSEYLKEAEVGKKKLILYQKMMQRKEQKRKEAEEEEARYKELQKKKTEEDSVLNTENNNTPQENAGNGAENDAGSQNSDETVSPDDSTIEANDDDNG